MSSKKGAIGSDKVVVAVLAVLIILVVVGFVVSKNPNWYYQLIPDLNQTYPDDVEISVPVEQTPNPCSIEGGTIVGRIMPGGDGKVSILGGSFGKVSWDSVSNNIKVGTEVVGSLDAGQIVTIDPYYLNSDNAFYVKSIIDGESFNLAKPLSILNGAKLKETYFCKPLKVDGDYSIGYVLPWPSKENVKRLAIPFFFVNTIWFNVFSSDHYSSDSPFYIDLFKGVIGRELQEVNLYQKKQEGYFLLVLKETGTQGCVAGFVDSEGRIYLGNIFGFNDWASWKRISFDQCPEVLSNYNPQDSESIKYKKVLSKNNLALYKTNLQLGMSRLKLR